MYERIGYWERADENPRKGVKVGHLPAEDTTTPPLVDRGLGVDSSV